MTCLKMYSTLRLLIFKPSIFSFEKDFSGKDNKSDLKQSYIGIATEFLSVMNIGKTMKPILNSFIAALPIVLTC